MNQSDFDAFRKLLNGCLSMWGDAPSAEISAMWFRCLAEYDMHTVQAAFNAHMRDPASGKFAPKPAHIIEKILANRTNDGRPGQEEAWAVALRSVDESETIVWTAECSSAWDVARVVFQTGDEVGARMAFREVYNREVDAARRAGIPVEWTASLGFNAERRKVAIRAAVDAGRLPGSQFEALLAPTGAPLLLGSDLDANTGIPDYVREKLRKLRESLVQRHDGPGEAEIENQRTKDLKRETAEKVNQHQASGGSIT